MMSLSTDICRGGDSSCGLINEGNNLLEITSTHRWQCVERTKVRESKTKQKRENHNKKWRCRESNPGPLALTQSFYGRSSLNVFSVLTLTQTCSQRTQL